MNQQDFLINKLEQLAQQFPSVSIKYGFNSLIKTHLVELAPIEEYLYNEALDNAWIPLSFEFRTIYPGAEISFISPESTLKIAHPIAEFNQPAFETIALQEIYGEIISDEEFVYTFPTSMISGGIVIACPIAPMLNYPKIDFAETTDSDDIYYQSAA